DDIHIIDICSPNSAHAEQLLAAMAAGKHIYCDKPLVVGAENMAKVEAALATYPGTAQMALQYRFFPATMRAKQLIDAGALGNIVSFRASYLHAGSVDPHRAMGWKQLKSEGGGVLQDLGSHVLDLMNYLIGPIARVVCDANIIYPTRPNAKGELVPVEADDIMLMLAKLPNGATGTIEASKLATGAEDEMRFEIHGDNGAVRFNCMQPNYLEFYDLTQPETPLGGTRGWTSIACVQRFDKPGGAFPGPKFSIGWIRSHMHSAFNFLQAIAEGARPHPSLADGLALQRMLAAAQQSSDAGAWVDLPKDAALRHAGKG
ncbi:MAG TPA: Gfo/Idh/MocA family oxidoreductase, partial [Armatimonadota bacterium]|nr:Gfo/Idh/MocA family oxidoreductase [Armatimonadota bacterium]